MSPLSSPQIICPLFRPIPPTPITGFAGAILRGSWDEACRYRSFLFPQRGRRFQPGAEVLRCPGHGIGCHRGLKDRQRARRIPARVICGRSTAAIQAAIFLHLTRGIGVPQPRTGITPVGGNAVPLGLFPDGDTMAFGGVFWGLRVATRCPPAKFSCPSGTQRNSPGDFQTSDLRLSDATATPGPGAFR